MHSTFQSQSPPQSRKSHLLPAFIISSVTSVRSAGAPSPSPARRPGQRDHNIYCLWCELRNSPISNNHKLIACRLKLGALGFVLGPSSSFARKRHGGGRI